MRHIKTIVALLLLAASATLNQAAQLLTLEWDPPLDPTVTGYKLYWGVASGMETSFIDVDTATQGSVDIEAYPDGTTIYFVARSYNAQGIESEPSNEVAYTKQPPPTPTPTPQPSPTPKPPENLRFKLTVIKGSGSGIYPPGTMVRVQANPAPSRSFFVRWIGDRVILANWFLPRTTATIPYRDTLIEAFYWRL